MKRLAFWGLVTTLAACSGQEGRTQVMLELDAECGVLARADRVALRVAGPDGDLPEVSLEPVDGRLLPRHVPLLPVGDDASRTFTVEAELFAGAASLGKVRAISGYVAHSTLGLRLVFEDGCAATICPAEETCVAGSCASAIRTASTLPEYAPGQAACMESRDAGVDGAVDGGADSATDGAVDAGAPTVTGVAAGFLHACALLSTGEVRCWGENGMHELGDGTTSARDRPTDPVGTLATAASVAAGNFHSCAVRRGGAITCWGSNVAGQLGDGTVGSFSGEPPTTVLGIDDAERVALGSTHGCAIRRGGNLDCWGGNDAGQLGLGTWDPVVPVSSPMSVDIGSVVVSVALGSQHTCAAVDSGQVYCWGAAASDALGGAAPTPDCGGRPGVCASQPALVPGIGDVVALAAGPGLGRALHTCALHRTGEVSCWGRNVSGQVGDGSSGVDVASPVKVRDVGDASAIAAGDTFTCAIRTGGSVWCWGDNSSLQLGQEAAVDTSPVPVQVPGLMGVTAISAGDNFACALLDGAVWCWGGNQKGQLGRGGTGASATPAPVRDLP